MFANETIAKTVTSLANSALFQSRELKVLGAKQASLIWAISGDIKNLQNDGISNIASLSTQIVQFPPTDENEKSLEQESESNCDSSFASIESLDVCIDTMDEMKLLSDHVVKIEPPQYTSTPFNA
eukprot:6274277-Ditylum_brightwellii.AAC.1